MYLSIYSQITKDSSRKKVVMAKYLVIYKKKKEYGQQTMNTCDNLSLIFL